ncbi:MAG: AAA family ATPase [Bacteriovoracia bacterium]
MRAWRILAATFCTLTIHLSAYPAYGNPPIDFSNRAAVAQWLDLGIEQGQYRGVGSTLENSVAIAVHQKILSGESPWKVEAVVNYHPITGEAWPVTVKDVQISQSPETFQKVAVSATLFLSKKSDPKARLVAGVSAERFSVQYNSGIEGRKADAIELEKYVQEEITTRSLYRRRAVEMKETGTIGFVPGIRSYNYNWDSIILESGLKQKLRSTVEDFINHYDYARWKELGLPMNRGILLDGPPGTGKSMVAKVILSNVVQKVYKKEVTYIYVVARHIINKEAVKNIFAAARLLNPAVVFIEDIDLIAGTDRKDRMDVKNELMQQLSGIQELNGVLTIGTTNVGARIDDALKRSKRLGFQFTIGAPAMAERVALFTVFTNKLAHEDLDFRAYGDQSEGMTGADIQELIDVATERAMRQGSFKDPGQGDGKRRVLLKDEHLRYAFALRKTTRIPGK